MFMTTLGKLLDLLKAGEVVFEFRTKSGKVRRARGTLNEKRIPKEDWAKAKLMKLPAPKVDEFNVRQRMFQPFYDLDKGEWRRFRVFGLLKIVSSKPFTNIFQKAKIAAQSLFDF